MTFKRTERVCICQDQRLCNLEGFLFSCLTDTLCLHVSPQQPAPYQPKYPKGQTPIPVDESDEAAIEAHEELLDQMEDTMSFEVSVTYKVASLAMNLTKIHAALIDARVTIINILSTITMSCFTIKEDRHGIEALIQAFSRLMMLCA